MDMDLVGDCYEDCNYPHGECVETLDTRDVSGNSTRWSCVCAEGYANSGVLIGGKGGCYVHTESLLIMYWVILVTSLVLGVLTIWHTNRRRPSESRKQRIRRWQRKSWRIVAQVLLIVVAVSKIQDATVRLGVDLMFTFWAANATMVLTAESFVAIVKFVNYLNKKRLSFQTEDQRKSSRRLSMLTSKDPEKQFVQYTVLSLIVTNLLVAMVPFIEPRVVLGAFFGMIGVFCILMGLSAVVSMTSTLQDYRFMLSQLTESAPLRPRVIRAIKQAKQMRRTFFIVDLIGAVMLFSAIVVPSFAMNPELLLFYALLVCLAQLFDSVTLTVFASWSSRHHGNNQSSMHSSKVIAPVQHSTHGSNVHTTVKSTLVTTSQMH